MKIRVRTLKRILREAALSPAVFRDSQPTRDPFDRPNVVNAVQALERAFKNGVRTNLYLANRDKYNEETREFDDATEQHIGEVADRASEAMTAAVHKAVQQAWAQAMKGAAGTEKSAQAPKRVA